MRAWEWVFFAAVLAMFAAAFVVGAADWTPAWLLPSPCCPPPPPPPSLDAPG